LEPRANPIADKTETIVWGCEVVCGRLEVPRILARCVDEDFVMSEQVCLLRMKAIRADVFDFSVVLRPG
jgi:hypothetical protein